MAITETKNLVTQREVFEKCADIVNDPAARVEHPTNTGHYLVCYKNKKVFEIYRYDSTLYIRINGVMFDSLTGEDRKFVSELYDRVDTKYAEQENSRNLNALNFLKSCALEKQKQ